MYMMYPCEHYYNFINCPTFQNTSFCQKTLELAKEISKADDTTGCSIKYENSSFFVKQDFWYYEDIEEEDNAFDCVIWQLF